MNEEVKEFLKASIVMLAMISSVYLSYTMFGGWTMNDDDLTFDVDLPNKFKIEVTQNHEGCNWYLCAYDNNGEHFSSYDCQNEKGVFAMISIISQEEMRE